VGSSLHETPPYSIHPLQMWAHISPPIWFVSPSNESRLFALVTELRPSTPSSLFDLFILILLGLGSVPSAKWEGVVLIIPSSVSSNCRDQIRPQNKLGGRGCTHIRGQFNNIVSTELLPPAMGLWGYGGPDFCFDTVTMSVFCEVKLVERNVLVESWRIRD
jgi:hypothetical protein